MLLDEGNKSDENPSGMNQGPTVVLGTETGIRHICSWEFHIFEGNVNHALVKQIMASFKLKPGFMNVSLMILVIRKDGDTLRQ